MVLQNDKFMNEALGPTKIYGLNVFTAGCFSGSHFFNILQNRKTQKTWKF